MGRSVGIPANDFCIHCGKERGSRVWVCIECQEANLIDSSEFWNYVAVVKDRMWNNAER